MLSIDRSEMFSVVVPKIGFLILVLLPLCGQRLEVALAQLASEIPIDFRKPVSFMNALQ